jgi:hypothetical protein
MIRGALRAYLVAIAAAAILGLAWTLCFAALCAEKRVADSVRARSGALGVLAVVGLAIARDGEQVAVCRSRHCLGPLCHEDLGCYCAPAGDAPAAIAARLGRPDTTCVIDKPHPRRDDATGACPRARCAEHLGPN